jgi:hypothetical protein
MLHETYGRNVEAEPLFARALTILEKSLPPSHPDLVGTLKDYAGLLDTIGRSGEASEFWAQAEAIRQQREQSPRSP